jgi:membrane-anchored protein YejM (alkaline phosphatase superfamily)
MKEITLPIKCNTVKWLHDVFLFIVVIEMNIWGIWSMVAATQKPPVPTTLIQEIYVFCVVMGMVTFVFAIAIDCLIVWEFLPTITCIKDE